ncbi:MAG TPA: sulfite exporter TauE/SafE family protein [Candidatus Limnocylindrales bacterium]
MPSILELAAASLLGAAAAMVGTPTGVSGGLLLLPVLITGYGLPGSVASATNLVFNVVSTPSALIHYLRAKGIDWSLARILVFPGVPAAVAGALVNVLLVDDPRLFRTLVSVLLAVVAVALLLPRPGGAGAPVRAARVALALTALASGAVGGFYGLGGAVLAAPMSILITRRPVREVAGAALVATVSVSVAGLATYVLLDLAGHTAVQTPNWPLAIALGAGGVVGARVGPLVAQRVPDRVLRGGLAVFVALAALRLSG